MNNYSLEIAVLNNQDNLIQLTVKNLTDTPLRDWLLCLDFPRFIFPESLSKGSIKQVGTYTEIKAASVDVIEADGQVQITFKINSAPLTNYECGVREAYITSAQDDFTAQHFVDVGQIKLQLAEQQSIDKITVPASEISIIPKVNKLRQLKSVFKLTETLTFAVDSKLASAASLWLIEELSYASLLTKTHNNDANVTFLLDTKMQESEYQLTVNESKIELVASSQAGFIHAVATLLQLVIAAENGLYTLSCVKINDKARFNFRGLMLDCSRHFHSISTIKRLINQMAIYKLNHFHWHFTDDEAWRLEIKAFPQLTEVGAWRGPGTQLLPQFSHLNEKYGGFYRQDEVKEVIEYASTRGITIIPEIDIPGHCRAAIKSLPELLVDADDRSQYLSVQSYTDNVLSPALAGTYEVLDKVIDEVCALFPSSSIHIGADEVPKGVWTQSPKCQALMKEQGYSEEVELQGHLLRHVEQRIKSHGKRMLGWEEVKHGNKVSKDTVVYAWVTEEAALDCVKSGFDVVLQPSKYTYFDLMQDDSAVEFGVNWAGTLPLQQAYFYEPLAELASDDPLREHILGVQCALWSEVVLNQDRIDHMLFPRLLAIAEVSWSRSQDKSWNDFCGRLQGQIAHFDRNNINYRHF